MCYEHLLYHVEERVATITLNRPKTLNALNTKLKLELADAFQKADRDDEVRVIVITGAGSRAFCSGQDLHESKEVDEATAKEWVDEFDRLYRVIKGVKKPIIASINGYATGSGLQLALLADIRIGSQNAKFGMTEINVGLPCIIGSTMFWEVMGKSRTIDLILTGRILKAEEAEKYCLLTRLVDNEQLEQATKQLALELADKPPVATAINKEWFNILSDDDFNNCMRFASEAHTRSYAAQEPQKMMEKFFKK